MYIINEPEIKLKRCPKGENRNKTTKICEPKRVSVVVKKEVFSEKIKRCPKGEHRNKTTKRCEPKEELNNKKTPKLSSKKKTPQLSSKKKTQKRMFISTELAQAKTKLKPLILPDIAKKSVSEDVLITVGNLFENLNEKGADYGEGLYYIGGSEISDILFFYLMKKYGNSCFLYGNKYLRRIKVGSLYGINIDLRTVIKDGAASSLVDITKPTPEILLAHGASIGLLQSFFNKIDPDNKDYINNYNILYNTIIINKEQIDTLIDCINNTSTPIIIMPLTLFLTESLNHRNMLIYRRDKDVIEHFEPYGGIYGVRIEDHYKLEKILELLFDYISILINKKLTYICCFLSTFYQFHRKLF